MKHHIKPPRATAIAVAVILAAAGNVALGNSSQPQRYASHHYPSKVISR